MKIALLTTDSREHFRDYVNPKPYFGTAPAALIEGFAQLPGVEVHVICCVRQPVAAPEKIAPNIFYHSLLVPKLGWMTTGYQGCIRAVRTLLKKLAPDIVHGQGTERDCAITAVFSGFPNVLTIHGNMRLIAKLNHATPFSFMWLNAHLERFTLPRSNGVVCITRYTQAAVQTLARRTWLLPNAAEGSFFEIERLPPPVPVILCVGHVCHRKNQNAFIRALDPLARERTFKVVFPGHAGRGDAYGAEFLGLIGQRPWCEWVGFENREQLKGRLKNATALALPSLEDNCPMVVLEAMAAGVPVIAANVGGVPDLVEDKVNGLMCDPLDAESMRSAVRAVLDDPTAAQARAETARQQARQRYHPRIIAARHVEIYREVLGKNH